MYISWYINYSHSYFHRVPTPNCVFDAKIIPHLCVSASPLTQGEHPGCSEPEEQDEDQQSAPWVLVHQYLENKAEGEVDVVERADAPVGGAKQHFAVQQDGPVHQVQAEEHQHWQQQLYVHQGLAMVDGDTGWFWGGRVDVDAHLPVRANGMDDTD